MKNQNIENFLKPLENIEITEPSPYLYTRIQQKINQVATMQMPIKFIWALGFTFSLIVLINVLVIINKSKETKAEYNLANQMNLLPNNHLYSYE
ncbi:MAG: hypothetical protein WCP57_11430 [Bacteroidota bacterium]